MTRSYTMAAGGVILALALPATTLADIQLHSAPLTSKTVPCVQTTIASVRVTRTGSGQPAVEVEFNSRLGMQHFPDMRASVDDEALYVPSSSGWADSYSGRGLPDPIALQEHTGETVQLCLTRVPKADPSCTRPDDGCCHPDTNPNGREYRVYNYRLHASYTSWNSHHDCGGA